jgi:CelD/BcsL family acetyltransferase involved in cellulose biosynthesis
VSQKRQEFVIVFAMNFVTHLTHSLMRRSAWIALSALLLNALVPSLAYAMATGQERKAVVEMCTSFEVKKTLSVQVDDNFDQATFHGIKHCPFCLGAEPTPSVPPVAAKAADFPEVVLVVDRQQQRLPDSLLFWSASHNRGPPNLS